jgi:NAD(P)-dependent dehydrogenase (short-subunit alcohol dehydrogenase family)
MPQTILITGAGRGLGLALAHVLTHRGHTVIGTLRNAKESDALRALGAEIETLDVADEASISALGERLKGRAIDVVVNNAGVGSGAKGLSELTQAELDRVFRINTFGPALVTRALLPPLRAGKRKVVMNISSQLGSIAGNTGGSSYAYRASKSALNQITRSMAAELGAPPHGFTCFVVHPGWVRTDMGGPGAPISPEESAAALAERIEKASAAVNGKFLNYDGAEMPW